MANDAPVPQRLLWLDLEMTGFDTRKDLITEVAAIITDFEFNVLAEYQSGVYQDSSLLQERLQLNPWFAQQSLAYQEAILKTSRLGQPLRHVEADLVDLVQYHIVGEPAILAGNSIHVDRGFIASYWPKLTNLLHYRILDVSSFKVYLQTRYNLVFEKQENHRALADIKESIAELKFYLQYFKP